MLVIPFSKLVGWSIADGHMVSKPFPLPSVIKDASFYEALRCTTFHQFQYKNTFMIEDLSTSRLNEHPYFSSPSSTPLEDCLLNCGLSRQSNHMYLKWKRSSLPQFYRRYNYFQIRSNRFILDFDIVIQLSNNFSLFLESVTFTFKVDWNGTTFIFGVSR